MSNKPFFHSSTFQFAPCVRPVYPPARSISQAMTSATGNSSKAPGDHARETNGDGGGSGGASNFNADGLSVSSQAWGKVDGDEVSDAYGRFYVLESCDPLTDRAAASSFKWRDICTYVVVDTYICI